MSTLAWVVGICVAVSILFLVAWARFHRGAFKGVEPTVWTDELGLVRQGKRGGDQ